MNILEKKGIKLLNVIRNGIVVKTTNGVDGDMGFVTTFRSLAVIERVLINVDMTISGEFSLIDNDFIGNDDGDIAFITEYGIQFWDYDGQNIIEPNIPLKDFKEMLLAWRDFLQTPPFDRSTVE